MYLNVVAIVVTMVVVVVVAVVVDVVVFVVLSLMLWLCKSCWFVETFTIHGWYVRPMVRRPYALKDLA